MKSNRQITSPEVKRQKSNQSTIVNRENNERKVVESDVLMSIVLGVLGRSYGYTEDDLKNLQESKGFLISTINLLSELHEDIPDLRPAHIMEIVSRGRGGFHQKIASLKENYKRLIGLGLNLEEMLVIVGTSGGQFNLQAFVDYAKRLITLGFSKTNIVDMASVSGASHKFALIIEYQALIQAIVQKYPQSNLLKNITHCFRYTSNLPRTIFHELLEETCNKISNNLAATDSSSQLHYQPSSPSREQAEKILEAAMSSQSSNAEQYLEQDCFNMEPPREENRPAHHVNIQNSQYDPYSASKITFSDNFLKLKEYGYSVEQLKTLHNATNFPEELASTIYKLHTLFPELLIEQVVIISCIPAGLAKLESLIDAYEQLQDKLEFNISQMIQIVLTMGGPNNLSFALMNVKRLTDIGFTHDMIVAAIYKSGSKKTLSVILEYENLLKGIKDPKIIKAIKQFSIQILPQAVDDFRMLMKDLKLGTHRKTPIENPSGQMTFQNKSLPNITYSAPLAELMNRYQYSAQQIEKINSLSIDDGLLIHAIKKIHTLNLDIEISQVMAVITVKRGVKKLETLNSYLPTLRTLGFSNEQLIAIVLYDGGINNLTALNDYAKILLDSGFSVNDIFSIAKQNGGSLHIEKIMEYVELLKRIGNPTLIEKIVAILSIPGLKPRETFSNQMKALALELNQHDSKIFSMFHLFPECRRQDAVTTTYCNDGNAAPNDSEIHFKKPALPSMLNKSRNN